MRSEVRVQQAYLQWLFDIIDKRKRSQDPEYRELASVLYSVEFFDKTPNDDNRKIDGLKLRERFVDIGAYSDCREIEGSCTVLEMLVALAERMDDILYDTEKGDQVSRWFWLLVRNLGLKLYLPSDPDAAIKRQINNSIIRKFVDRKYESNGRGGLFPLKRPSCDQRNLEIWYQMMEYLDENSSSK